MSVQGSVFPVPGSAVGADSHVRPPRRLRLLGHRFTRQLSQPYRDAKGRWTILTTRGWRITTRWFGVLSIQQTKPRPYRRDLRENWPTAVRAKLDQSIAKAVATGDLDKLRYWWNYWATRGYLTPATDNQLRSILERGIKTPGAPRIEAIP